MSAISHNLLFNKETRCYNDFGEDVRYYIFIYICMEIKKGMWK